MEMVQIAALSMSPSIARDIILIQSARIKKARSLERAFSFVLVILSLGLS